MNASPTVYPSYSKDQNPMTCQGTGSMYFRTTDGDYLRLRKICLELPSSVRCGLDVVVDPIMSVN